MSLAACIPDGKEPTCTIQESPDSSKVVACIVIAREYGRLTPGMSFYSRPIMCTSSKISSLYDRHEIIPGGFT
jgi:hypothetical protein